jgi:hypothetical protein
VNTTIESQRDGRPPAVVEVDPPETATSGIDELIDVGREQSMGGAVGPDNPSSVDTDAIQALIDMARSKQATMSRLSPERAYYTGVEGAAEQLLHPECAQVRNVSWLDRHNPAFLSGYLETIGLLAPSWPWPSDPTEPTNRAA